MQRFENQITIHKLLILRKELDVLIKERDKNQKIFDELCDNLDSGYNVAEASMKLSIILDRSDAIYQKLQVIDELFLELKSTLTN